MELPASIERIQRHFQGCISTIQETLNALSAPLAAAVDRMTHCLANNGKILVCGNGGSAADAQHFAAELIGRFERERPSLAAIALCTSGNSENVLAAVDQAHESGMSVIALTGKGGGCARDALLDTDSHLCVPSASTMRIQEAHALIIHCLCDGIDIMLLGETH